ncbi:zinc finger domain-containing protein [Methanogenium marinum]|uniref:Zinc finger domain-containing protein n=1 Tax=Methanogenium marinum TaxID=348610 RepID=A0A9Q4PVY7_9EURY|nr:zinc finger domain-containing protein [Methanogenium marinum]MDE4908515.1 zinc finger domain-containing protein [Methanogenium marinum]
MAIEKCTSCNVPLASEGWTKFSCPKCGETIYRCHDCRHQSIPYECKKCGFMGP